MTLTERQLAGNQRRTLRAMRERLLRMAAEWDGVDQFNMGQLEDLADQIEGVAIEMVANDGSEGPARGR